MHRGFGCWCEHRRRLTTRHASQLLSQTHPGLSHMVRLLCYGMARLSLLPPSCRRQTRARSTNTVGAPGEPMGVQERDAQTWMFRAQHPKEAVLGLGPVERLTPRSAFFASAATSRPPQLSQILVSSAQTCLERVPSTSAPFTSAHSLAHTSWRKDRSRVSRSKRARVDGTPRRPRPPPRRASGTSRPRRLRQSSRSRCTR